MYIKSYRILSISNKRATQLGRRHFLRWRKTLSPSDQPDPYPLFALQPKQLHRFLLSGTSFGSRIEKLSWIGMGTDIRHRPALPDHFH